MIPHTTSDNLDVSKIKGLICKHLKWLFQDKMHMHRVCVKQRLFSYLVGKDIRREMPKHLNQWLADHPGYFYYIV